MSVYADLHVHTINSDGTLPFAALPDAARRADVAVVAVTDHDRIHPALGAPVVERDGVTVVSGIELRADPGGEQVDLLGYGVRPTPALTRELDRLQADRIERGRAILDCLEDRLGVGIDVELAEGVGRPHVARAVADHPDTAYDAVATVFDDLIGEGRPCYVARDVTPFETAVDLLQDACDLVGLAHPFRYDDPAAALDLTRHLDAVERYYPYGRAVDPAPVDRAIDAHDLVPTGGSDAHGEELGRAGLTADQFERVRARLSDSPPPQG
ncbi:PHP domain-containing protein [Halobacteriaceae archaeon GCM10025711]